MAVTISVLDAEFYGCSRRKLESPAYITQFIERTVNEMGMTMLGEPSTQVFSDHSYVYALLRESHISVMAHPDDRFAYVSIVSCKNFDKNRTRRMMAQQLSSRRSIELCKTVFTAEFL